MLLSFLLRLVGLSRLLERRRAEASIAADRALLTASVQEDDARFRGAMEIRRDEPSITLGHALDGTAYRLPLGELPGQHVWVSGGTGSGKSTMVAAWVSELLGEMVRGAPFSLVFVVMQGFLGDMVLRALGDVLMRSSAAQVEATLAQLLVAQFFRGSHLPEWQILARDPSVPIMVQASAVADVLEASVGAALGSRQETALTMLLGLAIELGLTLQELRALSYNSEALVGLASRSTLPEVRLYILHRLARERAQLDGIGARLDMLLRVPAARAVLAGPRTLDLRACFRPGAVSVLDFSGEGMGAEAAKRTIAAVALQYLSYAIFDGSRPRDGATIIITDEIQEALTPATTRMLARWVTTARAFGAGLVSIHQSVSQIPRDFLTLLSTNIRLRAVGRSGREDAAAAAEFLPRTGRVPRSRLPGDPPFARPEFLSRAEEAEFRINQAANLPQRHMFLTDRLARFATREIVAPDFNAPDLNSLPPTLRTRLLRGRAGVPRDELLRRAQELESRAIAAMEASPAPARGGRRASPVPETPDVVEVAERWRRQGGRRS